MTHDPFIPKKVRPSRDVLEAIKAEQLKKAATAPEMGTPIVPSAGQHRHVAEIVDEVIAKAFPRHPQDRRLFGGPL